LAGGELEALVRRWDELLVAEKRWGEYWPVTETGTVLRAGASEAEIAALEARLGVQLPPSYRAFLAISNGAWA
jgi:cell wall assembly regulator SMI1